MKNIDIKSLIIGALFTSTIFLGVAATSPSDKWDDRQRWTVDQATQRDFRRANGLPDEYKGKLGTGGWEPFAMSPNGNVHYRKRIK